MKKYVLLLALFMSAIAIYGQNKVAENIERLTIQKVQFTPFSPLTVNNTTANSTIAKTVNNAVLATANRSVIKDIADNAYENIELNIPYNNTTVTVQLYRVDIASEDFHVATNKQENIAFTKGVHYRGIIKNDPTTLTSFNFFKNEMNGIISSKDINNLVVGRLNRDTNFKDYIIYSDADLNVTNTFQCNAPEPDAATFGKKREAVPTGTLTDRCVTMYFEIDYDIYQENFNSEELTINWMTSVFNNVQTLFNNDDITVAIKSMFIWTEPDPYSGESSFEYLAQFNEVRPVFDGDLGQLVGIDPGGLGGVAVGLQGLCTNNNYSYSDVNINIQEVPVFSWTVQVITHELGHLLGSPHTHGCYWNGNNTAIDGCGSSQGFTEGSCDIATIPSGIEGGTIMSYCHLVPETGINFANGFGIQPATLIQNNVNNALCLSTDCINTCINTVASYTITETTETTATIMWADDSEGPWEVSYASINGIFINWQEATENTFTATELNPNTYYKFSVRPVCPSSTAPNTSELFFATADNYCTETGVLFTDTGGLDNTYGNNERLTRTFIPQEGGESIMVTFTQFELEDGYDILYVYNGADTNAPLLGAYTGTVLPGPFESTAENGSLTFVFESDRFVTTSGWSANVNCAALASVTQNTFSNFSYYPNPTSNIVNITAAETITNISVYNVAGQLLLQKEANSTSVSTNIAAFAKGVYFFKVSNGNKEANFRVIKQ